MNVLLVEDQHYPLEALVRVVAEVMPTYDSGFTKDNMHIAKSYASAEERLGANMYDIVLLDHRMPRVDMGDLEETDFRAFSDSLEGIGYGLLGRIRQTNPNAMVIGTSSLSSGEIGRFERPLYKISKTSLELEKDLDDILASAYKK